MTSEKKKIINFLQEFSIPLIAGVIAALVWANIDSHSYHEFLHYPIVPFGHHINFHFLVNDIFMVFFFGIAAVEITYSVLPGGDLNPPGKAVGPLFATAGGVIGPAGLYFALCFAFDRPDLYDGWGIPAATDIALAWLFARIIFGKRHPAVTFLLLLAIADDAIGLAIIAIFYPDPAHPVQPTWLILVVLAMVVSYGLRRLNFKNYWLYILLGGGLSWAGLFNSSLHPALALVFIIPFMPTSPIAESHLLEETASDKDTLYEFEHGFKAFVDFGLFGFGLANAGVAFSEVDTVTWFVFLALFVGKTVGIGGFCVLAKLLKFPLPEGMELKETFLVGMVAGVGLTVALFVAGEAFTQPNVQGAAKMGAVFSAACGFVAYILARLLKTEVRN